MPFIIFGHFSQWQWQKGNFLISQLPSAKCTITLYFCLSTYAFLCLSVHLSFDLLFCESVCFFVRLFIYLFVCSYDHLFIHSHNQLSLCMSLYMSIHLYVNLFISLSICLSAPKALSAPPYVCQPIHLSASLSISLIRLSVCLDASWERECTKERGT